MGAIVTAISLDRSARSFFERAKGLASSGSFRTVRRWARGRKDSVRLRHADYAIVSYGKSGRTWCNVMLSKYFQLRYNLPGYLLIHYANLHKRNRAIPKILFTHDTYIRDYTKAGGSKALFYAKPTMLLVRHPADTVVSLYFHWRYRMQPHKKNLNNFPAHGTEIEIFDFMMRDSGLPRIVRFLNEWAQEIPKIQNLLLVRYEDLRANTQAELGRMLRWMGQDPSEAEVKGAVEFASFENLKQLETEGVYRSGRTRRLSPGDSSNPDSFKVRRAKVGGYRDYFDDEQVARIDELVRSRLSPFFGYGLAREGTQP